MRKLHCIFLVLASLAAKKNIFSQSKADSLIRISGAQKEDTNKANTLNAISWEYYSTNSAKSLSYAQQALKLSESLSFKKGIATALNTIGIAYYFKGNYPEALKNYIRATKILEEGTLANGFNPNKKKLSALYNNIAAIFLTESRYKDAEIYFFKSLAIDGDLGDKVGMAQSYNNIGTIYKDLSQFEKALDYYLKALALRKEIHDTQGLPSTLTNIGVVYINMHNTKLGLKFLNDAITLYRQNNDSMGIALAYNNFGDLYAEMELYDKAIQYYDSCLQISIDNQYLSYISFSYGSIAAIYGKQKNFEQAYKYQRLFMGAKDSIYNKENSEQLSELQTQYETDKKEKELKLKAAELQVKNLETDEANRQKAMFRNVFLIFIFFTIIFVAILINRYKIKQRANKELEEKNKLIEMQKNIVEQKQKEILDSIHYAQRIQKSLLPNDKYITRSLEKLNKG